MTVGNEIFRCVCKVLKDLCLIVVCRYDQPAVWRVQVSIRGSAGDWQRNSAAAL